MTLTIINKPTTITDLIIPKKFENFKFSPKKIKKTKLTPTIVNDMARRYYASVTKEKIHKPMKLYQHSLLITKEYNALSPSRKNAFFNTKSIKTLRPGLRWTDVDGIDDIREEIRHLLTTDSRFESLYDNIFSTFRGSDNQDNFQFIMKTLEDTIWFVLSCCINPSKINLTMSLTAYVKMCLGDRPLLSSEHFNKLLALLKTDRKSVV